MTAKYVMLHLVRMCGCAGDSLGSGKTLLASSCEHGNEHKECSVINLATTSISRVTLTYVATFKRRGTLSKCVCLHSFNNKPPDP